MGCCSSGLKVRPKLGNSLTKVLNHWVRRDARTFDVHSEDWFAFDKLRLIIVELARGSPTSVPVFDMALFISMANESSTLMELHQRYRMLEGRAKHQAHQDFVEACLKARYRFARGRCGFSIMCTFALLTGVGFILGYEDPYTLRRVTLRFTREAVFKPESVFTEDERERREREDTHVVMLRDGEYVRIKGDPVAGSPAHHGVCENFERWLRYCRTIRSSMQLPQDGAGTADTLAAVVSLLMFLDAA
eukprot:g437.t1